VTNINEAKARLWCVVRAKYPNDPMKIGVDEDTGQDIAALLDDHDDLENQVWRLRQESSQLSHIIEQIEKKHVD